MSKNNFDTSSSGIDITVNVGLDYSDNQWMFDEQFVKIDSEDAYLYHSDGNLDKEIDYTISPRQKGKVINCILTEFEGHFEKSELTCQELSTLEDWLYELCQDREEYLNYCQEHNIFTARDDYAEMETRGYSQGDYHKILVNKVEFEKVMGSPFVEADNQTYFNNIFWDTPQTVRATINDEEYISELYDTYYPNFQSEDNYNKDKFIAELLRFTTDEDFDSEVLKEELEELLPSECEYPSCSY